MITIRYRPLLDLVTRHGFFGNGPCQDLTFLPSAGAQATLRALDLRCETDPGTTRVWTKSVDEAVTLDTPLALWLRATNPAFAAYTEPDWTGGEQPGAVLAFGPAGADPGATLPSAAAHLLQSLPSRFTRAYPKTAAGTPFAVTRPPDPKPVQTGKIMGGMAAVDLSGAAEGRYALAVTGNHVEEFILQSGLSAPPFGCLTLAPAKITLPKQKASPLTLSLQFKARELIWDVTILTASSVDLSNAAVDLAGSQTPFNGPTRSQIRGQEAWSFRSASPMPLRNTAHSQPRFDLIPNTPALPDRIALARPGPGNLEQDPGSATLLARVYQLI